MLAACWRRNCRQLGPRAPGRRSRAGGKQDAPDRARRDTQAELQQLAGDPWVAPARVLACEAQHELAYAAVGRRTAGSPPRLRPFAAHELAVPAQQRLWCYDQSMTSPPGEQARKRGKERSISGPKRRSWLLSAEHGQLMAQHE